MLGSETGGATRRGERGPRAKRRGAKQVQGRGDTRALSPAGCGRLCGGAAWQRPGKRSSSGGGRGMARLLRLAALGRNIASDHVVRLLLPQHRGGVAHCTQRGDGRDTQGVTSKEWAQQQQQQQQPGPPGWALSRGAARDAQQAAPAPTRVVHVDVHILLPDLLDQPRPLERQQHLGGAGAVAGAGQQRGRGWAVGWTAGRDAPRRGGVRAALGSGFRGCLSSPRQKVAVRRSPVEHHIRHSTPQHGHRRRLLSPLPTLP